MFGGEASDKKVKVLSGGERSRLAMIKLLLEPVNFLILDEPTNHLDMRSKDVLKEAIREFDGTVIVVSHDREFLDGLVTKVYEFGGGVVKEHIGGIYDFLQKKKMENLNELQLSQSPTVSAAKKEEPVQASDNKLSYEAQKEQNKKSVNWKNRLRIVKRLLNVWKRSCRTGRTDGYSRRGIGYEIIRTASATQKQISDAEEEWENVSLELEELKS